MSGEDPFGRRGEEEGSGIPGGWLPPSSGAEPRQDEERRPLWSAPDAPSGDGPVFERPGQGRDSLPPAGGGPGSTGASSGSATAALVLGIVGLVICPFVCSVLAIVYGRRAQREIEASGGRLGGAGNAKAGIVLGWIGLVLSLLLVLAIALGGFALEEDGSGGDDGEAILSLVRLALA